MIPDFGKRLLVKTFGKIIDSSSDESEILEFVSTRGEKDIQIFKTLEKACS